MKKICIIILLCLPAGLLAQYQNFQLGLRGGYSSGITFRVNIDEDLSYEAQTVYRNQGAIFTMIRQKHHLLGMDKNGNWKLLYGMGAHAGFYFTDSYRIFWEEIYYGQNLFTPVLGVDGYIGIDYSLEYLPMSFGVSFQPHMEISLAQIFGINLWDFGVHVRYKF
jgi:hypothetical protein